MGKREVHYRSKVRGELYRTARYPFSSSILILKNRLTAACLFPYTALHLLGRKKSDASIATAAVPQKTGNRCFRKMDRDTPSLFFFGGERRRKEWVMYDLENNKLAKISLLFELLCRQNTDKNPCIRIFP